MKPEITFNSEELANNRTDSDYNNDECDGHLKPKDLTAEIAVDFETKKPGAKK